MIVVTRDEAKSRGSTRYFTGEPCKNGHLAERHASDGKCITCKNARHWRWEQANPEAVARYKTSPSWIAARDSAIKRFNGKSESRKQRAAYYQENRDEILSYVSRYNLDNPEKPRQHKRNYKARKKNAVGSHTAEQLLEMLIQQNHLCANPACRVSLHDGYHADHIIALINGGSNWISNIQLLCPTCNLRKNRKTPEVWAQDQTA